MCQRNPVIFSSRMKTAPLRWQSSMVLWRKPSAGSWSRAGSKIRQAIWPGRSSKSRAHAFEVVVAEGQGQIGDRRGSPAFIGVLPMNQSSYEKKGWSLQKATSSRPV